MAGKPGRSGGHNRLSGEVHALRGTYRENLHGRPLDAAPAPVSAADRRRVLAGLDPEPRRIATALLEQYEGWDAAALHTLRSYVLSCARLAPLQGAPGAATPALSRETRLNLQLLKALNLDPRP
jgi:hypothetical protein